MEKSVQGPPIDKAMAAPVIEKKKGRAAPEDRSERDARLARHTANARSWDERTGGGRTMEERARDEKPTVLVVVQTRHKAPVRLPNGLGSIQSDEQTLVSQRVLRILQGLSRRGVCQLVVGKIKLAGGGKSGGGPE